MINLPLRPYQEACVDKLQQYPNVLIADEMGSGKTVEAIALDAIRRQQCRTRTKTLVVAPLSGVVDSWVRHFQQWTELRVKRIDPRKRHLLFHNFDDFDVFVIHWEATRLMQQELANVRWLHVIADEAHKLKGRKTGWTKAMKGQGAKYDKWDVQYKTGLTGTPVINRPDELWSLLQWLYLNERERNVTVNGGPLFDPQQRKLLNSYWRFYAHFTDYIEIPPQMYHKILGPKNTRELKKLLEPIYIRRLKKEVLPDLPDKYYTEYPVDLLPQQRRAYDAMKRTLIAWVGEHEDKPVVAPIVIAQLMRLQQFAVAYGDVMQTPDGQPDKVVLDEPSSKLDALMDIADDLGDSKLVVFSQFSQAIDLAEARFKKAGYKTGKLTGAVPQKLRSGLIQSFQEGDTQVFLATIKAGGIGIDLYEASTVVFIDRDWSPAINQQAEDRLHRSGQRNAVQVIDLIARDTVDRGRHQRLATKWSWIKEMVGA